MCRKQACLSFEIALHASMKIQMVLCQVCEDRSIKQTSVHPAVDKRMGRNFHCNDIYRVTLHCRKHALKIRRLGSSSLARNGHSACKSTQGPDDSRLLKQPLGQVCNDMRGAGFAVCTRDTNDMHMVGWMVINDVCNIAHNLTWILNRPPRDVSC